MVFYNFYKWCMCICVHACFMCVDIHIYIPDILRIKQCNSFEEESDALRPVQTVRYDLYFD